MTIPRKYVNFIVDESGSMEECRSKVISGFSELLAGLKREQDTEILVSLTKFSTMAEVIYAAKRVANAPELDVTSYRPAGFTALLDAVGITVREVARKIAEETEKPAVLCVIMTDGLENASREFKAQDIRDLVQSKEAEGNWTFVYLGANQDALAASAGLGIVAGNTSDYNVRETDVMMAGIGTFAGKYEDAGSKQTRSFFAKQKGTK